jgi:serine/threonine protein kinase
MNEEFPQESLHQLALPWLASQKAGHRFNIFRDTSDFYRIEYGDILILNSVPYLVRHNAKEGRFGLDDEVKFWVKRAIDLKTGQTKVIKMVFYEKFMAMVGGIEFECFRSPRKEARILNLVGNHPNFMHGFSVPDDKGNIVRVIDLIYGQTLADHVRDMASGMSHETYFFNHFREILNNYIECAEAIRFLHEHGEKHGDVRRDHILADRDSGRCRWIDFDYKYGYDMFGLGNVLMYLAGMGDILIADLKRADSPAFAALRNEDMNIVFNNRVANLKKIYPYIPEDFNRILMHFSRGANIFYDNTVQLLDDLNEFISSFPGRQGEA